MAVRRKVYLLLLTIGVLLAGSLFGLAEDVANMERYGGIMKAAVTSNPTSVDPHLVTQTIVRTYAVLVYESLFAYDEEYVPQPQLLSTWEISEDGLEWILDLREGVRFHNGKEMTAEDVKASLDRYIQHGVMGHNLGYVEYIEVIGPYTVRLVLSRPTQTVPNDLADPLTYPAILPAEIIRDRQAAITPEEAIGTGPYKVVEWSPDDKFRFARFEDYVPDTRMPGSGLAGEKVAYFDEVWLIPTPEAATRVAGLETGMFDFSEDIPRAAYRRLTEEPNIEPLVVVPLTGIVAELNKAEPPMDNVLFRRAVLAAIDADAAMNVVAAGNPEFYRTQHSLFFPEQALWTEAGAEYYNVADPQLERELLREAGYNNEKIIYLTNRDYDWMYRASLAISQQLIAVGINIELQFQDWPAQLSIMRSLEGWHIAQSGWSLRFTPMPLAASLRVGAVNSYGYQNPRAGELIDKWALSPDDEVRDQAIAELMELFYTDVPHIRLGDLHGLWGVARDIEGMEAWYLPVFFNVWRAGSE